MTCRRAAVTVWLSARVAERVKPFITGLAGPALSPAEKNFIQAEAPAGFILFARNIENPQQVAALTSSLRKLTGRDKLPILIDQEGGRVQRMGPPHWPRWPAMGHFGKACVTDPAAAREALRLTLGLMAIDLVEAGITMDCLPLLDVPQADSDAIIGDRAFADDPDIVASLGAVAVESLLAGGICPVIKHIPGHGRASVDSHKALPRVDVDSETLAKTDFAPFRALRAAPFAMTAHIIYSAIDAEKPATLSPTVIKKAIRHEIGFQGLLMSDDLSMQALEGPMGGRASAAIEAGCDLVLHCNGDMGEMQVVAGALSHSASLEKRLSTAMDRAQKPQLTRAALAAKLAPLKNRFKDIPWQI